MKRRDFIRKFEKNGWWLERHGSDHDIYTDGINIEPVARHTEIDEQLAKKIIKRRGLK